MYGSGNLFALYVNVWIAIWDVKNLLRVFGIEPNARECADFDICYFLQLRLPGILVSLGFEENDVTLKVLRLLAENSERLRAAGSLYYYHRWRSNSLWKTSLSSFIGHYIMGNTSNAGIECTIVSQACMATIQLSRDPLHSPPWYNLASRGLTALETLWHDNLSTSPHIQIPHQCSRHRHRSHRRSWFSILFTGTFSISSSTFFNASSSSQLVKFRHT